MSAPRVIFRILGVVTVFLLSLSVIRLLLGADRLTVSYFLYSLQDVQIDFSPLLGAIARIKTNFTFEEISGFKSLMKALGQFFKGIWEVLTMPFSLFSIIFDFLSSVFTFLVRLIGVDFIGIGR